MTIMMLMVAKSKIMRNFNVSGPLKIIGWTAIVVMAAAAIGTAATAFNYLVGSRKSIAKKNVTLIDELRGSGDKSVGNVPTFAAGPTLRDRLRSSADRRGVRLPGWRRILGLLITPIHTKSNRYYAGERYISRYRRRERCRNRNTLPKASHRRTAARDNKACLWPSGAPWVGTGSPRCWRLDVDCHNLTLN
jgi:hypothetical protein